MNKLIIEKTTAEAYIRKEKERKASRKAKAQAAREGKTPYGSEMRLRRRRRKTSSLTMRSALLMRL